MKWILLPISTISELLNNQPLRSWVASQLPILPIAFKLEAGRGPRYCGRTLKLNGNASVVAVWSTEHTAPMLIKSAALLSVWSETNQPTIWSLGEEDRPSALERLCQLAQRIWSNHALPDHWEPKKIEGIPSIYVAGRQLTNLRIGYLHRTESHHRIIDIGSLYYARSQEKSARVPACPRELIDLLPDNIDIPEATQMQVFGQEAIDDEEESRDDADFVIALPSGESHHLFSLKFSDWIKKSGPLTKEQRRVISHNVQRPLRIHGPAGSGKTLVLILKALKLLHEASDQSERCHILVVAHSSAMRDTIRTAMEAIDDQMLMASRKGDPQYLDVETLHGWCIRELGLEFGPQYVLEADPTTSRERQKQILSDALEYALTKKYPGFRSLLSRDFVLRLDGDRDHFLKELGWEIAIRIKGRGFRKGDLKLYAESPMRSFLGRDEILADRHFIFHVYQLYEEQFEGLGLLDTDDVVLSMANRLTSPLWDRQRKEFGYDYVMVDETHLFNENERRVLPYLTRGTGQFLPLVMTFDEAQSIGGRRSLDLSKSGIDHVERRNLKYVHRSSPDIFDLARYFIDRSPLIFREFEDRQPKVLMGRSELRRCSKPSVWYGAGDAGVFDKSKARCKELHDRNYQRIGIIVFDPKLLELFHNGIDTFGGPVHYVRERGELKAAAPNPGVYLMPPDACGGLEFDAVILAGVDEGRTPPPIGELSPQGYLSIEEESFTELYTATTRAKYQLNLVCDSRRGLSSILRPALASGLLLAFDG